MLFLLRKSTAFLIMIAGLVSAAAPTAPAADLAAGRLRAIPCSVCHGPDGIAVNPETPNLAGESVFYIEKQLNAFKSGARQHEVMSIVAKELSDTDIANLAAWYSAMKVSVELPDLK